MSDPRESEEVRVFDWRVGYLILNCGLNASQAQALANRDDVDPHAVELAAEHGASAEQLVRIFG